MSEHPKPAAIIDGERIQLRVRAKEQAPEMFALIDKNRKHLRTWMPWEENTKKVEDSLGYIEIAMSWWEKGSTFDYSIYEKISSKMIGSFGFHSLNWEKRTCEFGYWIGREYEGRGYVSEAVRLGEKVAFELGFHRLIVTCDRLNKRSQQVPQRLGYKLEAVQIDECIDRGRMRDTLRFAKLLNPKIEGQDTENLPQGYSIKDSDPDEFWKTIAEPMERVFDDNELILRTRDILSAKERSEMKNLGESFTYPFYRYTLLLNKGELAGWTWGYQDSRESYYMVNSAVLPSHRGRGLYSRLLEVSLEKLISKGFQRIWSRHNITNNAVIIPKLKRGFHITGTELSDVFGSLIHLTYFTNNTRKKVLNFRAGHLRPDQELKDLFRI